MKNMFHLRWKPGGVSSGVSLGYQDSSTWPKWRSFIGFWLHELLMSLRMISQAVYSTTVLEVNTSRHSEELGKDAFCPIYF